MTVFTPAYNRAHTLPALYRSLLGQSCRDFEWLVVDDGSSDSTGELLAGFEREGLLPMRVFTVPNGGKHRAINFAVGQAAGPLFFIVDSDDTLPPDAIASIREVWRSVCDDPRFAGVAGNKCYTDGAPTGGPSDYHVLDTDPVRFRNRYRQRGDKAEVFRTDVLRAYPFPEFPGEKFLSEATVWNRIGKRYMLRYFNRGIYRCEYYPDGLTRSIVRHHHRSPRGSALYYGETFLDRDSLPLTRIKAAVNYWRYALSPDIPWRERFARIGPAGSVFLPAGCLFRIIDRIKKRL